MTPRSIRRSAAAALAIALLAAGGPADAAPSGVTATIGGLGRATELDLLSRGPSGLVVVSPETDLAASAAVGYGVAGAAPNTTDLSRRGVVTRAWSRTGNGTSAVLSTTSGLWIAGEPGQPAKGTTVGAVHRRSPAAHLAPVRSPLTSADPTVVESNLAAGGATWTWTYRGFQYLNDYDHGRQLQSALFTQVGGQVYNPTEAGDEWSNVRLDPDLRHGSPLASVATNGSTQSTRAIPLEWRPWTVVPGGGTYTPVLWQDVRLGKDLTLDHAGIPGVARYRTVLEIPQSLYGHLEMPTAYLRAELDTYYGVDAVAGTATALAPRQFDPLAQSQSTMAEYAPPSGIGGVVAATPDGRHAMGIYGVMRAAGGRVTSFAVHDFVPSEDWQAVPGFGDGQLDFSTSKLRAMISDTFPAGASTYEAFIVTGTLDEVVAKMARLAG